MEINHIFFIIKKYLENVLTEKVKIVIFSIPTDRGRNISFLGFKEKARARRRIFVIKSIEMNLIFIYPRWPHRVFLEFKSIAKIIVQYYLTHKITIPSLFMFYWLNHQMYIYTKKVICAKPNRCQSPVSQETFCLYFYSNSHYYM